VQYVVLLLLLADIFLFYFQLCNYTYIQYIVLLMLLFVCYLLYHLRLNSCMNVLSSTLCCYYFLLYLFFIYSYVAVCTFCADRCFNIIIIIIIIIIICLLFVVSFTVM